MSPGQGLRLACRSRICSIACRAQMGAASGGQPAREKSSSRPIAFGVLSAPLKESHPDRIIMGDRVLFLRNGTTCTYAVGTTLEVTFTEQQDGRSFADQITPVKPGN